MEIDIEKATVNDVVEGILRMELGYSEELSLAIPGELIYDFEFEDNLEKKLSNWGIKQGSLLTVKDESSEDTKAPLVDIEIIIIEK